MQTPRTYMRKVPIPVGGDMTASCALYPTPASKGPTNQGKSQPMRSRPEAVEARIQKTVVP